MHIKSSVKLIICSCIILFNNVSIAEDKVLLDWDQGSGQTLTGWTWFDDIGYGNPGWLLSSTNLLGSSNTFLWGNGPKSFNKGDYGKNNTAIVDINDRAPSTLTGGSLQVKETPGSTDYQSTWWIWYDGIPLIDRNIANIDTDRMSFYLKTSGMSALSENEDKDSVSTNFHIGTYLCWLSGDAAYGTGDGCPYEGPGNQHYYHYLSIDSGAWLHVLLDRHPQHLRGVGQVKDNPVSDQGKNYFAQLNQFYAEIRTKQSSLTSYNIDEITFSSTKDSIEPFQNDISISSLWVGYWPDSGTWQVGFFDTSFATYNDDSLSTFEIRWSTNPITNENYDSATLIEPTLYSGERFVGANSVGRFRKPNAWKQQLRTKFSLPSNVVSSAQKIYFAVKDVSMIGAHVGTQWPWNKGDGHDSPSSYIKSIDYSLIGINGDVVSSPAKAPTIFNSKIIIN
tara:strand:+ start:453 stop:1805 length:1353 start_codon:yes stop_codon:yes gene_type:complete